jgi:hypothetical protein
MSIGIGPGAISRSSHNYSNATTTSVCTKTPAAAAGILTSISFYFYDSNTGVIAGTFQGTAPSFNKRDSASIGSVSSGSKQTFTGLTCAVASGDFIGWYCTAGKIYNDTSGVNTSTYYKSGNQFGQGSQTYTDNGSHTLVSLEGAGISAAVNSTQDATSVTSSGCTGNGNVTDTGGSGSDVTRRGFCYKVGTSGDPTTSDSVAYDDGTFGTGAYTKAITGLSAATGYRVRAYVINAYGTFYGSTVQVTTSANAPTVTTQAASAVSASGCTGNGTISDTGGANATRRGFCYKIGTSGDPTTADSVAYDDGDYGTGAYTKAISGLSPGNSYRVRAYAVNSAGTSYGDTVQILTIPAAPTNVAATKNNNTKITVTWTKSTGAANYDIYRDGSKIDTVGDVATYDDTGAAAPVITPGSAAATDGTDPAEVILSLSGASVANGTTHTYKIVAVNATGSSADSATDTGFRLAGTLTGQWQRSAADSDASYSDIAGGTTNPYNDTGAPSDGSGRYYRVVLNATGSVQQISAVDRGYRMIAPTVTTQAATNVGSTQCTGNGTITATGGGNATRRGFCYLEGDSGTPTIADSVAYDDGDFGAGSFTKEISGLAPGTSYRVRAYAVNPAGTSYGSTVDVATSSSGAPTVTTQAATDLASTGCTGNGNITNIGNADPTTRGFCYKAGTYGNPSLADSVVSEDGDFGTGAYFLAITGLSPGTGYRVCAFATNSSGTSYGDTIQVNTPAVEPTVTTQAATNVLDIVATGNGTITATGGGNCNRRGFCFMEGDSGDPTTADDTVYEDDDFGVGVFSLLITGLSPSTSYRVRAYAINSAGTSYGDTVQIVTGATVDAPTVTTQAATEVENTTFNAHGNITSTGGANATRRGFCYKAGIAGDPTIADSVAFGDGDFGTGAFTKTITGLSPGTGYRVCAYAVNSAGISYGATIQVNTPAGLPVVTTQSCTNIAGTSALGNGTITATGGANATRRGFCYIPGVTGDPTIADSIAYDDGDFGGVAFTKSITGLSPGTGYRVRAYATNSAGTSYGDTVQLTTAIVAPTVTTQPASSVLYTSCVGNGTITDTGGGNATRRGFCYKVGTSGDPSTADSVAFDDGSFGTVAYTKAITGLTPATGYRVRAYAVNAAGTSYGLTVQVNTPAVPVAPTVTTQAATNVSYISATGNGNITALGGADVSRRGFCYKIGTSGNPTTADSVAYDDGDFGAGAFTKLITGLTPGTSYRVAAYAVNPAGTSYGATVQIATLAFPSVTLQVAADADDCLLWLNGSNWYFAAGGSAAGIGNESVPQIKCGAGLRFLPAFSKNTIINSAYLILTASTDLSNTTVNVKITGDKEPNASPFSNLADYQSRRGTVAGGTDNSKITIAQVSWSNIAAWVYNTAYNSPELKTIIQEIINQAGWANSLVLFIDDHDGLSSAGAYRAFLEHHGSPSKCAQLYISYFSLPTIITQPLTDLASTSCTGNGSITVAGTANAARRGFCYKAGTTGDPTIADSVVYEDGDFGVGAYSLAITGLTPGTAYRIRSYALNSVGVVYGDTANFNYGGPVVTTQAASNITDESCTGNGYIAAIGNASVTRRGFCYKAGATGDPTTADSVVYEDGSFSTGPYSLAITGLTFNSPYRIRSYAVNSAGVGYGETFDVLTYPATPPTVITLPTSEIGDTYCTGNGNITAEGDADVVRRGFCYLQGAMGDPTIADSVVYEDGDFATGIYSLPITGLTQGTFYRVRAYAVNSGGIAYGATTQIKTVVGLNFNIQKNRRSDGPTPINLLIFGFSTPVYLSDRDITPPGGSAHLGLIKEWGFIDTSISQTPGSGILGIIETADLQLTIINVPDSEGIRFSDNFTLTDPPENIIVSLYQWFAPLQYSEKQLIFKGKIYGQVKHDLYTCTLTIRGILSVYNNNPIGADKLITADPTSIGIYYPDADPNDIGKMENIGYGRVLNVPCRALKAGTIDTLATDILASDISFYVNGNAVADYPAGTVIIQIDDEKISGTYSQTLHQFTACARGYGGTTAVAHSKGAQVAEVLTSYVYEVFGHAAHALTNVRVSGVLQPATAYTAYTGKTGDQLAGYTGKAVIQFTALPVVRKQVNLNIDPGSHQHGAQETLAAEGLMDLSFIDYSSNPVITAPIGSSNLPAGLPLQLRMVARFNSGASTPVNAYLQYFFAGAGGYSFQTYIAGSPLGNGRYCASSWNNVSGRSWSDIIGGKLKMVYASGSTNNIDTLQITAISIEVQYAPVVSPATGVAVGGNSSADTVIGGPVTVDAQGYQDDASGTYTGTPNALIEQPDHVFRHIWAVLLGASLDDIDDVSFNAAGAFYLANTYRFAKLISEPIQAAELLSRLAFQCRSRFVVTSAGVAKLFVRQLNQISIHSVIKEEIKRDSLSIARSNTDEILNYFTISYNLDLRKNIGSLPSYSYFLDLKNQPQYGMSPQLYNATLKFSDSTSISRYGQKEWKGQQELFCFDAVNLKAMAQDVGNYLLAYHCRARKILTFGIFLDNMEIEEGQIIDITHPLDALTNFVIEVQKRVHHIGSVKQIDWVEITGVENGT